MVPFNFLGVRNVDSTSTGSGAVTCASPVSRSVMQCYGSRWVSMKVQRRLCEPVCSPLSKCCAAARAAGQLDFVGARTEALKVGLMKQHSVRIESR